MTRIIRTYVFADKYDVPALKSQSLNLLFDVINNKDTRMPWSSDVRYAFEHTPNDSPLCRLLVDGHCKWTPSELWEEYGGYSDADRGVSLAFLKMALRRFSQLTSYRNVPMET